MKVVCEEEEEKESQQFIREQWEMQTRDDELCDEKFNNTKKHYSAFI